MANKDLVVKMTINSKEFENGLQLVPLALP